MQKRKLGKYIESVLKEDRLFISARDFSWQAQVSTLTGYRKLYRQSIDDPESFWAEQAERLLSWKKPWEQVLKWQAPNAKWFIGGQINVSANCLDRHLETELANKAAILWKGKHSNLRKPSDLGKPGEKRALIHRQLHREVCRFANELKKNCIGNGDRILIYLPMVPETATVKLTYNRITLVHSVVFSRFNAQAVADHIEGCKAKMVISATDCFRRGSIVPLNEKVDQSLEIENEGRRLGRSVAKVIILRQVENKVAFERQRNLWWHEEVAQVNDLKPPTNLSSEHPCAYTSLSFKFENITIKSDKYVRDKFHFISIENCWANVKRACIAFQNFWLSKKFSRNLHGDLFRYKSTQECLNHLNLVPVKC